MATIYVHPGFKKALHKPDAAHTGLITAIYYLGTWTSYIFISHPLSDYLGRRYAASAGVFVVCVGAALQAGARGPGSFAMMIVGRILAGMGVAVVSTSVPMYQRSVEFSSFVWEKGKWVKRKGWMVSCVVMFGGWVAERS